MSVSWPHESIPLAHPAQLYAPTRTNAKFAPLTCNAPLTVEISTRVSAIAGDALVLFATWRVTYGVSRVSHLVKPNIPITLLLLRDGGW